MAASRAFRMHIEAIRGEKIPLEVQQAH